MGSIRTCAGTFAAAALAGLLLLAPARSLAQSKTTDSVALRKAQDEFVKLQEELARVNAEITQLKRADRSVRGDYRLRDRMADAEALAQRLGRAETRLRALERPAAPPPATIPLLPPPQASPQDGSVELEAKADLFADQASKLEKQAEVFARAADQLRTRKALRRRAGVWDRDPFAGLESSKRNVAASAATQKSLSDTPIRGTTPPTTTGAVSGGTTAATPAQAGPVTFDSAKTPSVGAIESPASKTSPLAPTVGVDHPSEQRLFLDPTMAVELRQALGAGAGSSDPDALDRAATALRTRARQLAQQADTLRRKSRAP
jgi:hypothetical protein